METAVIILAITALVLVATNIVTAILLFRAIADGEQVRTDYKIARSDIDKFTAQMRKEIEDSTQAHILELTKLNQVNAKLREDLETTKKNLLHLVEVGADVDPDTIKHMFELII